MALDETARGPVGFLARRARDVRFLLTAFRFVLLYVTDARHVRRRYREARRSGATIWLDDGPFQPSPESGSPSREGGS